MRLIDADALDFGFAMTDDLNGMLKQIGIEMAKARVDKAPTIEAEPVRHGRWVHAKTYYDLDECNCSLCGQLMTTEIGNRMNYCPNCGANMRGDTDE